MQLIFLPMTEANFEHINPDCEATAVTTEPPTPPSDGKLALGGKLALKFLWLHFLRS